MKAAGGIVLGIIIVLSLMFSLQWLGIANYRFFAPKNENARREVFEETQSFVEAKRQAITKYYNEWRKADDYDKEAIRTIALQEFSNFDTDKFTRQQYGWYLEIIK